jgi:hypothetical protein
MRYLPLIPRHLSQESAVLTHHCRELAVAVYLQKEVSDTMSLRNKQPSASKDQTDRMW